MKPTPEDLTKLFKSSELSDGDKSLLEYSYGRPSSFTSRLWDLINIADSQNLDRIGMGFPEHIKTHKEDRWTKAWSEKIRKIIADGCD